MSDECFDIIVFVLFLMATSFTAIKSCSYPSIWSCVAGCSVIFALMLIGIYVVNHN